MKTLLAICFLLSASAQATTTLNCTASGKIQGIVGVRAVSTPAQKGVTAFVTASITTKSIIGETSESEEISTFSDISKEFQVYAYDSGTPKKGVALVTTQTANGPVYRLVERSYCNYANQEDYCTDGQIVANANGSLEGDSEVVSCQ